MSEYTATRYLQSKTTVDDRALNQGVVARLREELSAARQATEAPLRVLEIGCGLGNMLTRLIDWQLLGSADYTFVDLDREVLAAAQQRLSALPAARTEGDEVVLSHSAGEVRARFVCSDAFEYVSRAGVAGRFDFVIANALLDLMDLEPTLRGIWRGLTPGALYWFTINFDGETLLLPELPLDAQVMAAYHRTMDERLRDGKPSGSSKTGRLLLTVLPKTGAELLAAGGSDWVVFPARGAYVADEQYFLRYILATIAESVAAEGSVPLQALEGWLAERRAQVDRAELCYVAHQLDVMGRAPTRR